MKICDICKKKSGQMLTEDHVVTVEIGTNVMVASVNGEDRDREIPIPVELCAGCIKRVNESIADHLEGRFGLKIRWLS